MAKREETRSSERRESVDRDRSASGQDGRVQKRTYFPVPEEAARESASAAAPRASRRQLLREIAPTISPLIVGFTLLLAIISALGYLSIRKMDDIRTDVRASQLRYSTMLEMLLDLKFSITKLDNEARVRHDLESRGGVIPPFDFRVNSARDEVNKLFQQVENPSLNTVNWVQFRQHLQTFMEATKDLRAYSLGGRSKYEAVIASLEEVRNDAKREQLKRYDDNSKLQQTAGEEIRFWTITAVVVGLLVALGTVWEVQRRFRETQRSTEEARRERTFASQMIEGMVSAVAAIDEDNRLRSANAAFLNIFPGAVIGASILEQSGPDDAMKMLAAATDSQVSKSTYRGRWVCGNASEHTEKTFDVYSSPLAINGDQGQIVTLVDATEASEFERGLRRSESLAAVGQATAQVAHEIRNPLGSIRLGVSMLRDSVKDEEALNTIDLVERGITHLNKLVVDVTQFSRQKALERSQVDLHELLDRSLDLVSESITEKQTPVEKKFSSERITGNWDGHQLQQVFVNVISNAVDASRTESPITISTKEVTVNGTGKQESAIPQNYARVVVADQGKGIDPTKVDRIFEPFFSTKKRGTGLGLAIVKQIVEQHGGRISVDSQVGKGTRFTIDLPM